MSRYEIIRSKALELFSLSGFGQVSMRDLASHLGLSAGSLYHHFPTKQHLLFELLEEFYEDLGAILKSCRSAPKDRSQALQRFISARMKMHHANPLQGRLAGRDAVSLEGEHRLQIDQMKNQFEVNLMQLVSTKCSMVDPEIDAAGHALVEMITNMPDWLENYPLSIVEKIRVAERLIMAVAKELQQVKT